MFTALLIYYGACAVGLVGTAKVLEHVADNSKESGSSDCDQSPLGDNIAPDGEPYGMPYMP